jgi:enterochelin esterase-like enzyme
LLLIFAGMQAVKQSGIHIENMVIPSVFLQREIKVDFYLPHNVDDYEQIHLLLINDGQNMEELGLEAMLDDLLSKQLIEPVVCIAIHAGEERKMEYGVSSSPDFKGRGAKASLYTAFIFQELFPQIFKLTKRNQFSSGGFAGFSLGGLSAFDIVWNNPAIFSISGVFSGSFWWRSVDQTEPHYEDDKHRIIHQVVRQGEYKPGLRFFFQCGNMDETRDRNKNGIIDSIEDTLDLIKELNEKGWSDDDIKYLEMPDGRHDTATWARSMPEFLTWAYGRGTRY